MVGFIREHADNLVYVLETFECCDLVSDVRGDVLTIDGVNTRLYLKITNSDLVISHINLVHKRIGTFSKILIMLNSISKELNLNNLVVENVSTLDMECFCKKNNFKLITSPNEYKIYTIQVL